MRPRTLVLLVLLGVFAAIVGVAGLIVLFIVVFPRVFPQLPESAPVAKEGAPVANAGPAIVTSANGDSQVRIPAHWSRLQGVNEHATIQVGNKQREEYMIVVTESKSNFADDLTYRDYSRIRREDLIKNLDQARVVGEPTELLINGRRAVRYELHGVLRKNRLKIVYLHTTVDGEKSFHQIVAWTMPSRLAEARAALEEASNSFRELP